MPQKITKTSIKNVLLLSLVLLLQFGPVVPAYAINSNANCAPDPTTGIKPCFNTSAAFPTSNDSETLGDFAGRLISLLLRLVATAAISVVGYGGYRMIVAEGNDTGIKKGQTAFMQAVIGTIIVLMAYIVVSLVQTLITVR